MAKKTAPLFPVTDELLRQFGDRLRLARLRRRLPAKQVAERAGMSPMTLRGLERGGSGVTMGAYLAVMQVLGIEKDLDLLGKADPVGRELQDAQLSTRTNTTRPSLATAAQRAIANRPIAGAAADMGGVQLLEQVNKLEMSLKQKAEGHGPVDDAQDWIEKSGFASADALASLIAPVSSTTKKAR
jgi:transcriptional regulator with XRE-family HTH domain